MTKVRVLIGKNVKFFRGFFGDSILRQADIDIVDEIDDAKDLLELLADTDVDVILMSMQYGATSGLPSQIFALCPSVTLVLVNENHTSAYMENLCPNRSRISDVSPDGIMRALRVAVSISPESDQESTWRSQH